MRWSTWQLLPALLAGLGLGLSYAWGIAPLQYVDASPASLRPDFKEDFRAAIAAAYASTGNLERARARLSLLGDPDPVQALGAQAQQMLAAGEDFKAVQQVARLAADLQSPQAVTIVITPSLEATRPPADTPGSDATTDATPLSESTGTVIPDQVIEPPPTVHTPTARPTRTSTPAPGAPFELSEQETVCESNSREGLLEIILIDARRRPLPGLEIVVTWAGGEDHFFTGLKPELGNGYADYLMQAAVVYSVRVAEGGQPVSNVSAPSCAAADGGTFTGGIRLTFQRQ